MCNFTRIVSLITQDWSLVLGIQLPCDIVNTIQTYIKMQQIQVTFKTPTRIHLQVESNQIWFVITFLNSLQLCDFNEISDVCFIINYYTFWSLSHFWLGHDSIFFSILLFECFTIVQFYMKFKGEGRFGAGHFGAVSYFYFIFRIMKKKQWSRQFLECRWARTCWN